MNATEMVSKIRLRPELFTAFIASPEFSVRREFMLEPLVTKRKQSQRTPFKRTHVGLQVLKYMGSNVSLRLRSESMGLAPYLQEASPLITCIV